MFSVKQKRHIAQAVQNILRATNHPELPEGEINFSLRVVGATAMSWAEIKNNGRVESPSVNPHNERQDPANKGMSFSEALTAAREMVASGKVKVGPDGACATMDDVVFDSPSGEWRPALCGNTVEYRFHQEGRRGWSVVAEEYPDSQGYRVTRIRFSHEVKK